MGKRILHVDAAPKWLRELALTLKSNGHQISSCTSLSDARAVYRGNYFDVVICNANINLEGDGLHWAEELHAQGQKVIVLAISGRPSKDIPFIDKRYYEEERLLALINE